MCVRLYSLKGLYSISSSQYFSERGILFSFTNNEMEDQGSLSEVIWLLSQKAW